MVLFLSKEKERVTQKFPGLNPLNPKIKNLNSHLLPLFISYRSSGEKLIKFQANSSCVIMSIILMNNWSVLQGIDSTRRNLMLITSVLQSIDI